MNWLKRKLIRSDWEAIDMEHQIFEIKWIFHVIFASLGVDLTFYRYLIYIYPYNWIDWF